MTACFDFSGTQIERYYHFHCTSDTGFLQLLDELGIADKMNWTETRMGYWFNGRLQPWGNPIALLRFRGLSLIGKFRYGLMAFVATKRKDWKGLDNVEASAWVKRWVGEEAYEILWRKLFEYKFHHFTGNLSAAWIWSRIRRMVPHAITCSRKNWAIWKAAPRPYSTHYKPTWRRMGPN